ncbi:MAG: zinc ribbon domain-containing protein [Methanoregula sp.]|jgi:ribosomal protein L37E
MTRKCGNCGATALDSESRFCDLCGAPLVDVPDQQYPVCPSCGAMIPDDQAQFCDKCGASLIHEPRPMVCPTCGNPALDENSRFCSRCGTTFGTQQNPAPAMYPPQQAQQQPVEPRRSAPIQTTTGGDANDSADGWTPWSDGPEGDIHLLAQNERKQQPRYGYNNQEQDTTPQQYPPQYQPQQYQGSVQEQMRTTTPRKKYAHLPLVADELKEHGTHEPEPPAGSDYPPQENRQNQKKGGLRFLR